MSHTELSKVLLPASARGKGLDTSPQGTEPISYHIPALSPLTEALSPLFLNKVEKEYNHLHSTGEETSLKVFLEAA